MQSSAPVCADHIRLHGVVEQIIETDVVVVGGSEAEQRWNKTARARNTRTARCLTEPRPFFVSALAVPFTRTRLDGCDIPATENRLALVSTNEVLIRIRTVGFHFPAIGADLVFQDGQA
jgi:hypothetical protein